MAEVKWIKLATDMRNDAKIKHIRRQKGGNDMVLLWIMLLCLAGEINDGGMIYISKEVPYHDADLADELGFPVKTVTAALNLFIELGMIEILPTDETIVVTNWEKHQNVEKMEKIREQGKLRQQNHRKREKERRIGTDAVCAYCGGVATTIDHIVPISQGGSDEAENCVPCCAACNSGKRDTDVVDFLNRNKTPQATALRNAKIKRIIEFDYVENAYRWKNVTLQNALRNATDKEREEEREREKRVTPADAVVTPRAERVTNGGGSDDVRPSFNALEVYAANNLPRLTPGNMQDLVAFKDEMPEDVIKFAIDKACGDGKGTWSYTQAILRGWLDAGVKTVGEAKVEIEKHRKARTAARNGSAQAQNYQQSGNLDYEHFDYFDPTKECMGGST